MCGKESDCPVFRCRRAPLNVVRGCSPVRLFTLKSKLGITALLLFVHWLTLQCCWQTHVPRTWAWSPQSLLWRLALRKARSRVQQKLQNGDLRMIDRNWGKRCTGSSRMLGMDSIFSGLLSTALAMSLRKAHYPPVTPFSMAKKHRLPCQPT